MIITIKHSFDVDRMTNSATLIHVHIFQSVKHNLNSFVGKFVSFSSIKFVIKYTKLINAFFPLAKLARRWQITFFLSEGTLNGIYYRDSNTLWVEVYSILVREKIRVFESSSLEARPFGTCSWRKRKALPGKESIRKRAKSLLGNWSTAFL